MAGTRTFVLVPSTGTAKLAGVSYTDGADLKIDEVVTLGEPLMPAYALATTIIAASTAAAHLLTINAGPSLNFYLRRLVMTQSAMATAAFLADIQLLRTQTSAPTGGTAVGSQPLFIGDTAGCTAMTLPTVKATEAGMIWRENGYFVQTMPVSGAPGTGRILDLDFDKLFRGMPPRISAGVNNGVALKLTTAPVAATVTIVAIVSEAPY